MITVRRAGPEDAPVVHELTKAAFAGQESLTPPSGAVAETEDTVREHLAAHDGALAYAGDEPVGALRMVVQEGYLHVRRVAVDPEHQGRGVCSALMRWAEDAARAEGVAELHVGVRDQLPANRAIYEHLGYTVVAEHGFWTELAKRL